MNAGCCQRMWRLCHAHLPGVGQWCQGGGHGGSSKGEAGEAGTEVCQSSPSLISVYKPVQGSGGGTDPPNQINLALLP